MRSLLTTTLFVDGLVLCLWFAPLDRVWHLFQAPNSFPGRWSFVVSCFILLLGYDTVLWILNRIKTVRLSKFLPALLVLVLAVDMASNAMLLFQGLDKELGFETYASYHDYKLEMQPLINKIGADEDFSRVVSDVQRSRNEPAAFGYKGLTFFSSSYDADVNYVLGSLGLVQKWFWSTGLGSTPGTDLLLGVNYHISNSAKPDWYIPVAQSGDLTLYRTAVSAAPAYFTEVYLLSPTWGGPNNFAHQSVRLTSLSGVPPVFVPLDALRTDEELSTTWTLTSDGNPMYGYFVPAEGHNALLYVNGVLYGQVYTNETDCPLYLGTFPAGEPVEITLITGAPAANRWNSLYTLDTDALSRAANVLSQNAMQVTSCSNGEMEGTVTATADGWLYTSIPAQSGWTVRVDGKMTEHTALDNALIVVPLSAGEHTVTFSYSPPGLVAGLGMAVLGAVLTAILLLKKRK